MMEKGMQHFNGSYDHDTRTLHFTNEQRQALQLFDMLDEIVAVRFNPADVMFPGFGYDPDNPTDMFIAKIESVSADKDGVRVKLTTEGITKGAYAKRKVKESFDRVNSGEYYVGIIRVFDAEMTGVLNERSSIFPGWFFSDLLSALAVELEVEGSKLNMKPKEERCLTYNKKEKRVESILTSKVMEEVGKKLAEGKPIKLLTEMKDGSQLKSKIISLEKDHDNGYIVNIQGNKKTLNYINNENKNTALSWGNWYDDDDEQDFLERRDGCTRFDQKCICSNTGLTGTCGTRAGAAFAGALLCNCD